MRAQEFIVEYRRNAMVGGIDLSFEYDDKFGESARVQAFSNGRKLGYAEFLVVRDRELEATDLEVDERYRGQGIAQLMYDFVKQQGYKIHRSHAQTADGSKFWDKNRGEDAAVWEQELSEISRDRLERYLSRAGRQVDTRQERMALARQRLSTSYEIYHADEPTKIVDRFEADTPADAQRYYQDYIERYESDRDYDLRLRRGTGIMESYQRKLNFDEIYGKYLKVTDNAGDPNRPGFSLVTPLNGDSWNWRERPEFIPVVKKKLNQPGWLGNHKYQQIIDAMAGREFDPKRHIAEFAPSPDRDNNDDVPDPVFVLANRWWNAAEKQPQIESVLNSMGWSIQQVESEDDAVQLQHRDGTTYFISADDFDPDVFENFADGKKPGRKGLSRRVGIPKKATLAQLQKIASSSTGERRRMAQWQLNMRRGKAKKAK